MITGQQDRRINTRIKVTGEDKQKRLPHERDESPESSSGIHGSRKVIRQAKDDLERGLVDTDLRGMRGVEKAIKPKIRKPEAKE